MDLAEMHEDCFDLALSWRAVPIRFNVSCSQVQDFAPFQVQLGLSLVLLQSLPNFAILPNIPDWFSKHNNVLALRRPASRTWDRKL